MALVYSCCFWFSLRLGGIIIGVFSMVQGMAWLAASSVAYTHPHWLKDEMTDWVNNMELIFTKPYFDNILADLEKFLTMNITIASLYIIICITFIYAAYTFSIFLMLGYILVELARLVAMSVLVVTWLLIIKQNTMDIGLLIGASVASGFFLLGMFYLWVCTANLPILINEVEKDEQAATIERLRAAVAAAARGPVGPGGGYRRAPASYGYQPQTDVFMIPNNKSKYY